MPKNAFTGAASDAKPSISADEIIEKLLDGSLDDISDIEETVAALGSEAAGKFVFAYYGGDGGPAWAVTPVKYWEETGAQFDDHCPIDALLPDGAGEVASCWWVWEEDMDPVARALDLIDRGFAWDSGFQRFMDGNQELMIQAVEAHLKTQTPAPAPGPR